MKKELYGVNVKIWFGLAIASLISAFLVIPYSSELTGTPIPAFSELMVSAAIGFVQFSLYAFVGLKISRKIGLDPTPILSGKAKLKDNLKLSVFLGALTGLALLVISSMFTLPIKEGASLETVTPGPLVGFLASFYGGIAEELFLRLLTIPLLCLLIIGVMKLTSLAKTWKITDKVAWASIIIAAILFGIGHLQTTAAIMDITATVVLRALLLNGIAGIVFGWLFYRKGLESAMISHFSTDIVLHVLLPMFLLLV